MMAAKSFSFLGVRRIVRAEIDIESTTHPLWLNRGLLNVKVKFDLKFTSPESDLRI